MAKNDGVVRIFPVLLVQLCHFLPLWLLKSYNSVILCQQVPISHPSEQWKWSSARGRDTLLGEFSEGVGIPSLVTASAVRANKPEGLIFAHALRYAELSLYCVNRIYAIHSI